MKEDELRELTECQICNKKIGELPLPVFWKVEVERYGLDLDAVNRQQGLTMMLGGEALLARTLGANEDMAKALGEVEKYMICDSCFLERIPELF